MSIDLAGRTPAGPVLARWLTPPLVLLLAACTATEVTPGGGKIPSPFADCATLTPPAAGSSPAAGRRSPVAGSLPAASGATSSSGVEASPAPGVATGLPDVTLACFTGGAPVRLTDLRGPAVINLWGSWCAPCREELPLMQELADATTGRLRVLGVDTHDDPDAGASLATEHGVRMPTLFDRDQKLLTALGRANLPVTVFLDAGGKRFDYVGKALDKPTLGALVRTHTGVTVTG
ncbi:TlpA disulfide reductase family protein [Actinoplanes sp. NPDC051475]|uniref:TlpA family protein disulfide reductase n=1 Tax=Actinoplanes sp. NPDC051475 TaxID=3157225 RepID=UPI00344DF228